MSRKARKKPDWSPVEPSRAGLPGEESPAGRPGPPRGVQGWLEDGGRPLEADFPVPEESSAGKAAGPGKMALADALGHTGWRPADAPNRNRESPAFPGSGFLDALFLDFPFPAEKREVARHLAEDAALHAGPAATFLDLVVRLERDGFEDIHDLKRALGERLAWASAHNPGGPHDG